MVTIQENTKLKEAIQEAINKATALSRPILVSEVQAINKVNALSFFASGRELFFGERFFWKDSSDETFIVGLGICKKIQVDQGADRFFRVQKKWDEMLEDCIVIHSSDECSVGPTLLGGFSFDPYKEKTELWANYAHSLFNLPLFMYSEKNGQAYLTTNIICDGDDDEERRAHLVEEQRQTILSYLSEPIHSIENELINQNEINPDQWMKDVDLLVDELKDSPLKKVVLAREARLTYKKTIQVEQVLERLLDLQKNSFTFALEANGDCFIGATPERLVKMNERQLFTTCLAGSTPRGDTFEEDKQLGAALLSDEKNLIEHQYVVEMIKGAIGELCEKVCLPKQPQLMKMRDIQHLYTPVTGTTKEDTSLLLLVERLHPTPALGGMPKEEAVVKIREIEELDRGFYGAPIGWLDYRGNGDFAVAIRSGLIQGKEASIFAGCGVVRGSDVASEYEETQVKFRPMLSALGGRES